LTALDLKSKYLLIMVLRFNAILYSNLGNKTSDADHTKCLPYADRIWPAGRRFPTPALNLNRFRQTDSEQYISHADPCTVYVRI